MGMQHLMLFNCYSAQPFPEIQQENIERAKINLQLHTACQDKNTNVKT